MNLPSTSVTTTYHRVQIDGVSIFYREAGPARAPTIVLLHGYPSSSRMFDALIPLLATRYHLIAPDYPGFGQSQALPPSHYEYTFDHIAATTGALLEHLHLKRYVFYLQDYGGPVGFRIAMLHPERVQTLLRILSGSNGCDNTSHRHSSCGGIMTRPSFQPVPRHISETSRMPKFICSMPVELPENQAAEALALIDKLEQDDDVQKVFHTLA